VHNPNRPKRRYPQREQASITLSRAWRGTGEAVTLGGMVGFRVIGPEAGILDVVEADAYDVGDDGALVLLAGGREIRRVPAGDWVEVRALGLRPPPDVASLLDDLCVGGGLCLPPEERARLRDSPPVGIDAFTDAVMLADGLDPVLGKELRRRVRAMVARHFARDGDRSDLGDR
jgi:hypothetical protein